MGGRLRSGFRLVRRLLGDRRGATAILFAVLLPVLIRFAGLGVETGLWYTIKRQNQTAADEAALPAALEIIAPGGTVANALPAAQLDANKHRFGCAQHGHNTT